MKSKYSVSRSNQLTVTRARSKLKPRGYFLISDNNELIYVITEPAPWRKLNDLGQRITFKGTWTIDKEHNLVFNLEETRTQAGNEQLVLKTQLQKAKADGLVFSLGTEGQNGTQALRLLKLQGKWQADEYNRLQFVVQRLKTNPDTLTFTGIWEVKHNTLIYSYCRTSLKTRTKYSQILRFTGYWELSEYNRLTYIIESKETSSFTFRAYLETPNLIEKDGVIKYRVGIGIKGTDLFKERAVSLYGVWKLYRKTGLSFEMDYADAAVKEIRFGVYVRISEKNKITLDLRSTIGSDLGINLTLTRTFLKNKAQWFLRLASDAKHPRLEWGLAFPW